MCVTLENMATTTVLYTSQANARSAASLHAPAAAGPRRPPRPGSAPLRRDASAPAPLSALPTASVPDEVQHRVAPRLPPQQTTAHAIVGNAAGTFSRVAAKLRDAMDSPDGRTKPREAAWYEALSGQVDALRTLHRPRPQHPGHGARQPRLAARGDLRTCRRGLGHCATAPRWPHRGACRQRVGAPSLCSP